MLKPVLKFDCLSGTVTVTGKNGRIMKAGIEHVRNPINSKLSLASAIHDLVFCSSINCFAKQLMDEQTTWR